MAGFALSNYDLRHLRTFLAVVEYGGVSAAAYRLDANLSSVSRDLSALEKRIGIQLCRRGRSGFALTPQGEDVHRAAVKLFSELQSFEQTIQSTRQTLGGGFSLGVIDNVVTNPEAGIVAALTEMHRTFPDMLINVSVHTDPMIDIQVRERRIDVGVTGQPEGLAPLEYEPAFVRAPPPLHEPALAASGGGPRGPGAAGAARRGGALHLARLPHRRLPGLRAALPPAGRRPRQHAGGHPGGGAGRGSAAPLLPIHFVAAAGARGSWWRSSRRTPPLEVQFYFVYRRDAANRRAIGALLDCFRT